MGLIFGGGGGGGGGLIHECKNSARVILPCQIYLKKDHIQIYIRLIFVDHQT